MTKRGVKFDEFEDKEKDSEDHESEEYYVKEKHIKKKKSVHLNVSRIEKEPRVNKIPYTDIELGEFLGRGTYGVVFCAKWNDKVVAVKSVGTRSGKGVPKEVVLLSKIQHPNIVDFYGYAERSSHNKVSVTMSHVHDTQQLCCELMNTAIFLVMEYADCGSLYDVIHRFHPEYGPIQYTPAHVLNWALQCAEAMDYLHTRKPKIIHRDLKPSNILLSSDCEMVKVCDFGEARTMHTDMTAGMGTPLWMAPEVINGTKYTEKCDVYSFGIVLWEMIFRKKPFHDLEVEGQGIFLAVYKGLRPTPLDGIPWSLKNLIVSCWDEFAKDRPSFNELIKFLRLAFMFVHEGDENFFTIVGESQRDEWDIWSEDSITLQREHSIEFETAEHFTEDTASTATKPLNVSPLSADEFRQLLKNNKKSENSSNIGENNSDHHVLASNNNGPSFKEIVESNKSLFLFLGSSFLFFTIHCLRYR